MRNMRRLMLAVLLILLVALPAAAQDGPAEELQKELWCPICQGIRLDVCEQKVCEQMRDMINSELASGATQEEIKAQFIELYGPVVLGEPPREGFNLIAWIVPVLLLVGGFAFAIFMTRRWSQKPTPPISPVVAAAPDVGLAPPDDDPYLSRVERELDN